MKFNTKALTFLVLVSLLLLTQLTNTKHIDGFNFESKIRNLGEKKDQYCKGIFSKEQKVDPNGEKYEAETLVTQEQRNEAESVRNKLQSARSADEAKEDVKKMLNNNDYAGYASSLFMVALPFLILLALGIIGSFFYWCCFFLEKFCCKRDLDKSPYTESELGRPAACIFIFGLGAIGAIGYGFMIMGDFGEMASKLECAIISVLDEVTTKATIGSYEWIGLSNTAEPIENIITELDNVATQADTYFADTEWINLGLENVNNLNAALYDYYQGREVPASPNPTAGTGVGVTSVYIRDRLGPLETKYTVTNNMQAQINATTLVFANTLQEAVQSTSDIRLNVETIKDSLRSGKQNIQTTNDQFLDIIEDAEKSMSDIKSYNDLVNLGLQGFFGAQVLGALLGFLGVSFTHCTGPRPKCRVLLHLGWFIMSIMMIVGLVISSILVPTGVMLSETCTWMQGFLEDEKEFNDPTYTFLPADIMAKISTCKFGDGNLNENFAIDEEMDMINSMIESVAFAKEINDATSENYIDLDLTTSVMGVEMGIVDQIARGNANDSDDTDDDNARISLQNFNLWADSSDTANSLQFQPTQGNCQKTVDRYVLDYANCTALDGFTPFNDPTNDPKDPKFNLEDPTCIAINDLTLLDQATRYSQILAEDPACEPIVETKLQTYFLALFRYDMSRRSFFEAIRADIEDLQTQTDAYHVQLRDFMTTIDSFSSDLEDLTALVQDEQIGLMSRFNCTFLGESMDRVYDALCVSFVSPIFKVILSTAIASVSMFFASFFSFTLAIRYARKVRPKKDKVRGVKKEKSKAKKAKKEKPAAKKKKAPKKEIAKKKNPQKNGKKPTGKKVKKQK